MPDATRINSDLGNWIPVARHYEVPGGHLVVVVFKLFTATGTEVFYADNNGGAFSMEPIARFPDGTTHDQALADLGYTVIDNIGDGVDKQPTNLPTDPVSTVEQSVLDILPTPIAEMVASATGEIPTDSPPQNPPA
jgi:hypothetical protein